MRPLLFFLVLIAAGCGKTQPLSTLGGPAPTVSEPQPSTPGVAPTTVEPVMPAQLQPAAGAPSPVPAAGSHQPVDAVIYFGASGCRGTETDSVPPGIPEPSVRLWATVVGNKATDAEAFGALQLWHDGTHGAELQLGLEFMKAGRDLAIVKASRNSTKITDWVPGTRYGDQLLDEVKEAKAALPREFPLRAVQWHLVAMIGGNEARLPTPEIARAWGESFRSIHKALEGIVGGSLSRTVVQTSPIGTHGGWTELIREQQRAEADHLVSMDDLPRVGGLHPTGAAQNVIGARIAGALLGRAKPSQAKR